MTASNQDATPSSGNQQMWIEMAPHNGRAPNRLLVFLHGAGSTPELFTPLALAWQFKFPGAAAIVMQGLLPGATGSGYDWFEMAGDRPRRQQRAASAAGEVASRIRIAQEALGLCSDSTTVIGFSQGAMLALEIARLSHPCASIIVTHAGQLLGPLTAGQTIAPSVHLLHGEFDSLVLAQHSLRAYRALRNAGARVSIDIVADGVHSIDQEMVNVGTTRVMQTVFRDRKQISLDQYGPALTVSMDSGDGAGLTADRGQNHH